MTLEEFPGSHKKGAFMFRWRGSDSGKIMLKMLALVGLPSLRGRDACVVFRVRGIQKKLQAKFT